MKQSVRLSDLPNQDQPNQDQPNQDQPGVEWHPYCVWKHTILAHQPEQVINRNIAKRRFRQFSRRREARVANA